jgi:HPt (histidine-containing phosphotransfer) domain-containing protein
MLETLVASFLHDAQDRVAAIEDAVRAGDAERIRQVAHAYKSSAAQLGAHGLAEALQSLELAGRGGDRAAAAGLIGVVQREHQSVCAYLAAAAAGGE